MKTYKAILFHPEGDFVTDFERGNKEDVWNEISEIGSRWIFYPIPFVATDKTIIDAPEGMEYLKGKRITTVKKFFQKEWEQRADAICEELNDGMPLDFVYPYREFIV